MIGCTRLIISGLLTLVLKIRIFISFGFSYLDFNAFEAFWVIEEVAKSVQIF
jgi:hypothetical protein